MDTDNAEPSAPAVASGQLDGAALQLALERIPVGRRIEEAFAQYLRACFSLGYAKTAAPRLREIAEAMGSHPLSSALNHLETSLTQTAVLDAAATYDQAGEGSSSLANSLNLITRYLKSAKSTSAADREAARALVSEIRDSVITHKSPEMKLVQYWRNKWAGHRTLDAQVDPWARNHPIDFAVIEAGLDQMRAAFRELALLIEQLPVLATLSTDAGRIDDRKLRMGLSLEGTSSWPLEYAVGFGVAQAEQLLERMLPSQAPKKESS